MGNLVCFPRGKPAATVAPPNLRCMLRCFSVSIIHRIRVNACDCTRWCTNTVRESALKVDFGRKVPCCTGESNLRQQRASPTLYQLSYIPKHTRPYINRRRRKNLLWVLFDSIPVDRVRDVQSLVASFGHRFEQNWFSSTPEVHEKGKRKLGMRTVKWDWRKSEEEQQ